MLPRRFVRPVSATEPLASELLEVEYHDAGVDFEGRTPGQTLCASVGDPLEQVAPWPPREAFEVSPVAVHVSAFPFSTLTLFLDRPVLGAQGPRVPISQGRGWNGSPPIN
jgi:hypothetical protein